MSLMDLIDKARELISGGGIDSVTDNVGELSDAAQGEGSLLEKAQQAVEDLGTGGGDSSGSAER